MRDAAVKGNDMERIQAWAGQSAGMARTEPAERLFDGYGKRQKRCSHSPGVLFACLQEIPGTVRLFALLPFVKPSIFACRF